MELVEVWKKLESQKLNKPVPGSIVIAKKSRHPIEKIKVGYRVAAIFSAIALLAFALLLFFFDEPVVRLGLAIMMVYYAALIIINYRMIRKISTSIFFDETLRETLALTYQTIQRNIRFQQQLALFVYPWAAIAGYALGASVSEGEVLEFLRGRIPSMVILAAVLTPLAWYITRWASRISYGACLKQIKDLMDEMERPEEQER
jgi:hypothetical protein